MQDIRDAVQAAKLDPAIVADVVDGTAVNAPNDLPTLQKILKHTQTVPARQQWQAYRVHWKKRRSELSDIKKDPNAPFPLLEDVRTHPDRHRGQLVLVRGHVRRVARPSVENDDSMPPFYRLDVVPLGSEDTVVVVLVHGDCPDELLADEDLWEPVSAVGYFLKLTNAGKQDQPRRRDPLVVAGSVDWHGVILDPDMLSEVKDKTAFPRSDDREAYLRLLSHVQLVDYAAQQKAASAFRQQRIQEVKPKFDPKKIPDFVDMYVDLFNNPAIYRGRPVELRGYARRIIGTPAGKNEFGIDQLYEIALFTDKSQTIPAIVVCTDIPDALKRELRKRKGANLDEPIHGIAVTGYLFKLGFYDTHAGRRAAPILVAQRLTWTPPTPLPEIVIPSWAYALIALIVGGMIAVFMRSRRKDRAFQQTLRGEESGSIATDLSGLVVDETSAVAAFPDELDADADKPAET